MVSCSIRFAATNYDIILSFSNYLFYVFRVASFLNDPKKQFDMFVLFCLDI